MSWYNCYHTYQALLRPDIFGGLCLSSRCQADGKAPEDKVTFCQECGNNVHVECFKRWTASKKDSGEPVTCVYCRCPWVSDAGATMQNLGSSLLGLLHGVLYIPQGLMIFVISTE